MLGSPGDHWSGVAGVGRAADGWAAAGGRKILQVLQVLYFCPDWTASPLQDLYRQSQHLF